MRAFISVLFVCGCSLLAGRPARAAITSEGQVQISPGTTIVGTTQGDGVLRVTPPSTLTTSSLQIAQGGSIPIVNGGVFVEGGAVVVQSQTAVGSFGRGLLEVTDGGTFDSPSLSVGSLSRGPFTSEGRVVVRGVGSRIRSGNQLTIGDFSFGEVVIENGGRLQPLTPPGSQSPAYLGRSNGGIGAVRVDGQGSMWQHSGEIVVGNAGNGILTITGGAVAMSTSGSLGKAQELSGGLGSALISGPGSRWSTDRLTIGENGAGELRVEDGGLLDVGNIITQNPQALTLGMNPNSFGRLVVSGAGAQWTGGAIVGDRGVGELVLEGGVVATGGASLGRNGGSGLAIVRGPGTRWQPSSLVIGPVQNFPTGIGQSELRIEDGAVISIPGSPTLAIINPAGRVVLDGGTFRKASFDQSPLDNRGVLEGNGDVVMSQFRNFGGRVSVGPGDRLRFSGALSNTMGQSAQLPGQIEVFGGELEVMGNFNNSTGRVMVENGTLRVRGVEGFANTGHLAITGGVNRVFGRVTNSTNATMAISGNSHVTFYDAVRNTGVMSASAGSHVTILGAFSGTGIMGAGSVDLEGPVQPGTSPGVMTFGGDIALGGASRLEIEVSGLSPGTGFDQLKVNGTIELGGALRLTALAALNGNATLPIVEAGELLGTFSSVPAIGANLGFGVRFNGITYDYNRDEAVVSLVQGQAGDFNLDGVVNGGDLMAWQLALGTIAEHPGVGADANCDGLVDGADLEMWRADMAAAASAAAGANAVQAAVPEPASLGLVLVGCLAVAVRRRGVRGGV